MKTDRGGCSTCPAGQEWHETFYSDILKGQRVQYDYRTPDGKLFSCIARSLEQAREKRNAWLANN